MEQDKPAGEADKKVTLPELHEHLGEPGISEKKYELFSDLEVTLDAVVGEVALTVSALMVKKNKVKSSS
jgi:flagellar motor switch/type III secretory pathway protein FliN